MKLIVGLGNPGREYQNTRHNIGFMVIDNYLGNVTFQKKFNAEYYETNIKGEKVIFIKPLTFMNLSGNAVSEFVRFYKINLTDILVIHDDLDLPVGKYKIKVNSSSGGHNGIKSIISSLNSEKFARLKIGISNNKDIDTKDYVLGRFTNEEMNIYQNLYSEFNNIINDFLKYSIDKLMSEHNRH